MLFKAFFFGMSLVPAVLFAQAPCAVPVDGAGSRISACWPLDGALSDGAGKAEDNLAARGGRARFFKLPEAPSLLALGVEKGDAQFLAAPASEDLRLGPDYTIAAWIAPTALGQWNRIVLHWGHAPEYAYHLAIHNGQLSLYHGQADGKLVFAEGGRVAVGRLQHVAAVARRNEKAPAKSTLTVYLDGKPVGSALFDGTIRRPARGGVGIGDSPDIPSEGSRFKGYLANVSIRREALSAGAIQKLAEAPALNRMKLTFAAAREKAASVRRKAEIEKAAALAGRLDGLGVTEIVFAERGPGRDTQRHYYANFGYSCIDPDYWLHAADGGRLLKLNVKTGELKALIDDPRGGVRDPQVHYDAEKILFSYRKGGSHHYHLYEIDCDGRNLKQLTGGPWDDVEPAYLPDGGITFCSTRCNRWIGCWVAQSAVLYRCDGEGRNIRMLSSGAFTENTPSVLPDGRILYTRWEYVNRDPVSFHHLWTMNPDGTKAMAYYGNAWPGGVFIDAKPLPGGGGIVMIHSPGHGRNEHEGYVAVATDRFGSDFKAAMRHVSAAARYRDPCPLSSNLFLVARNNQVLLMDDQGESRPLYTSGDNQLHEPFPVRKRPREKMVPAQVDPAKATGTVVLTDVYAGRKMAGVKRGAIKKLLILEDLPKPANFHGGGSQPIGHGVTSTLKRILGTVPVHADGSACFQVPAMRSLYFAALDEKGLSVKQMRSFLTLQPGETVSCVGCHEHRGHPPSGAGPMAEALRRRPSTIQPISHVPQVMDFPRDIQPILDRHCIRCHNGGKREGGVNLTGNRGPVFSLSYYDLLLFWQVKDTGGAPGHGSGRQPGDDAPYSTYSAASALMQKIDGSHHDVVLTPREKKLIRLWIDSGAAYPGTYAAYGTGQIGGCWGDNKPVRVMADEWPSAKAAESAIQKRCGECHDKFFPRHVTDLVPLDAWGDMLSWTRPLSRFSRHRLFDLSKPEASLVLLTPLARQAGGFAVKARPQAPADPVKENRKAPPRPIQHAIIFKNTADPDYQVILAHINKAREKLDQIKRFDMPGFRPNEHYIREMKRYGLMPQETDGDAPVDVYELDEAYWRSFWHVPTSVKAPARKTGPWQLDALFKAPSYSEDPVRSTDTVKAIFYDGLSWKGKPTRVFAYLGLPASARSENAGKVPAMVLVHGGGGSAFIPWVKLWQDRGYAAIAMDTCGSVSGAGYRNHPRHDHGGPPGWGGFQQVDEPVEDQWTYHAVADVILAHSLIRSLPQVDPDRTGLTGISWGGYLTCIVSGIDHRFKFAAPVYGCGFLGDNSTWLSTFEKMGKAWAGKWLKLWDPSAYLSNAVMPMLWVTGTNDFAYPMDSLRKSYRLPGSARTLCVRLRMPHGHGGAGENPREIHVMADAVLRSGQPLSTIAGSGRDGDTAWITYQGRQDIAKAVLNFTKDAGAWQKRKWSSVPAELDREKKRATARLPEGTTVYYFNLFDVRGCAVSSEHVEKGA